MCALQWGIFSGVYGVFRLLGARLGSYARLTSHSTDAVGGPLQMGYSVTLACFHHDCTRRVLSSTFDLHGQQALLVMYCQAQCMGLVGCALHIVMVLLV